MAANNHCLFIGNLTRDPETRTIPSGDRVTNFGLAVNGFKKGDVMFLDCEAWGKTGDDIAEHCKKGEKLSVTGDLKIETWNDKTSGEKRTKPKIQVNSKFFLGGNKPVATEDGGDEDEESTPTPPAAKKEKVVNKSAKPKKAAPPPVDEDEDEGEEDGEGIGF